MQPICHTGYLVRFYRGKLKLLKKPQRVIPPDSTSPSGGGWGHYPAPDASPKGEVIRELEHFFPWYCR